MQLAKGIEMLEITSIIMGKPTTIYPALIQDGESLILVDTGFPGQLPEFHKAIEAAGASISQLTDIIITHQDIDHLGNLPGIIKEQTNHIEILSHEEEKPYIEGSKTPIKLSKLEANLASLPENMKEIYKGMKAFYDNCKVVVDKTFSDEEELPYCGGITIIHTPGHTPGHICLYHKDSKTLIAGDALGVENGILIKPPAHINYDNEQASTSLRKLSHYDIENVISYHGGFLSGNISSMIAKLADE